VRIVQRGSLVEVRVTANAFLRRMVRSIVALLIEAGRGRLEPSAVEGMLEAGGRALSGRAAPARGLTLERVIYSNAGRDRPSDPRSQRRQREQES
jgi:tRNA pseudouridine38-40 synthase